MTSSRLTHHNRKQNNPMTSSSRNSIHHAPVASAGLRLGIAGEPVREPVASDGGTFPGFAKVPRRHRRNRIRVNLLLYAILLVSLSAPLSSWGSEVTAGPSYYQPANARTPAVLEQEVAVYGGIPRGVTAAIQASRMGRKTMRLSFNRHVGGVTSGGLTDTDIGNKDSIGGLTLEFHDRLGNIRESSPADAPPAKPNIILIMADDLGYAALGSYGQRLILTPEIDKMAADGMRFTDFYAGNTVCVPSRVSMLMGMHPGHAPIRDNFLPHLPGFSGYMEEYPGDLWPPKLPTLGQVMKKAGYKTAQFGKLEAGIPLPTGKMTEHGWDYWFGFKGTGDAFQYYPLELWKNDEKITFKENRPDDIRRPGIVGNRGVYSEDLFVEEILDFIRRNKGTPFFVYFPTQVPHGRSPKDGDEIQVPDIGPYADREWTHLEKLYAAAITRLDSHVGRIIQELKDQGIDEKTVILFTSDNGDENSYYKYTKRFGANGPLKGKKRFLYEGGIRVPMIARWPGRIQPAQTGRIPAAGWDIMATLAELAGAARPAHTDGISLVPTLLGHPERQQSREYLYWEYHMGKQQAVRLGSWKGIRCGGTKEPIELYNLDADIGETHNVADGHPDIVARITAIMEKARANSEFNRFWPLPEHRQNQIKWDKVIFDQLEHGIR